MSEKISLFKKSFYVVEQNVFRKQSFHVYEEENGKKMVEESVYLLKKDELEFSDKPTHSSVREVGDDFVKNVHDINFGNFYINGGDSVSLSVFLQCVFLKTKNKKLKKQIVDLCKNQEVLEIASCIPRDILRSNFDIGCD
jgi:hypothetical protein